MAAEGVRKKAREEAVAGRAKAKYVEKVSPGAEEKTIGVLYWTRAPGEGMETAAAVALAPPERASWAAAPAAGKKSREKEEEEAAEGGGASSSGRRKREISSGI